MQKDVLGEILSELRAINGRLENLEKGLFGTNQRIEKLEQRFEKLEQRFDKLEQRFDKLEQRFDRLEHEVSLIKQDVCVIKKDVFEIKEHAEVTRSALNSVIEWADEARYAIKLPLPSLV